MNYVIKLNDRYLAPPVKDTWNADVTNWTIDINEARVGSVFEMNALAKRIDRPGLKQLIRVEIEEL